MDPIADLLSIIKNGYLAGKPEVAVSFSRSKEAIVKILIDNQYLTGYVIQGKTVQEKQLVIKLKYDAKGKPAVRQVKRVSKPSLRHYVKAGKVPVVLSGYGMSILTTSKGIMSSKRAWKNKLGGEIICEVY
ncbi:30S ribosomal protein S8 [Patescibacteria group bacterium]|nr:30S ribosomal protein S8 [Patescibacteria group bacterium]MBU1931292.1 30S ribosomal protein S8 [Patescibacteria group bacterium]